MNRRIAVRGVIIRDGRLLAVRLTTDPDRPDKGNFWCLPGGGLEAGESLLAGLEREMVEETGVKPVIDGLLYIQQFKDERYEYLEFFFAITNAEDYEHINLAQTSHGTLEIAEFDFIEPRAANLLPAFLRTADIAADRTLGKTRYFNNL